MATLKAGYKPAKPEEKKPVEGSAEEERNEPAAEAKAEGDPDGDARKSMFKRHEKERADLHGSFRDQHRKMTDRHEKEAVEMMAARAAQSGGEGAGDNA